MSLWRWSTTASLAVSLGYGKSSLLLSAQGRGWCWREGEDCSRNHRFHHFEWLLYDQCSSDPGLMCCSSQLHVCVSYCENECAEVIFTIIPHACDSTCMYTIKICMQQHVTTRMHSPKLHAIQGIFPISHSQAREALKNNNCEVTCVISVWRISSDSLRSWPQPVMINASGSSPPPLLSGLHGHDLFPRKPHS